MRALVTGATGFVGRRLLAKLQDPLVLSRDPDKARLLLGDAVEARRWEVDGPLPPPLTLRTVDTILHLAGEPVAGRWTAARRRRIRESRVVGTRRLVEALAAVPDAARPKTFVCASAVGLYGDRGDEELDEGSAPGNDFLAEVCGEWEAEAAAAAKIGMRVACIRTGIVLGAGGGALAKMLPPFRMGVGGRLGSGRQWMSWIHIDDLVGIYLHAATKAEVSGPVNGVGPAPVTNADFTRVLARVLHRPALFPVPGAALKIGFGGFADILLGSQKVLPRVAERTGYKFLYPDLEAALRQVLAPAAPGEPRKAA